MTAPQVPGPAVAAASPLAAGPGFTDAEMFARMLANDEEIEVLLKAVRAHHTMDISASAISSVTRALGTIEMLRLELRHCRNEMLGGGS